VLSTQVAEHAEISISLSCLDAARGLARDQISVELLETASSCSNCSRRIALRSSGARQSNVSSSLERASSCLKRALEQGVICRGMPGIVPVSPSLHPHFNNTDPCVTYAKSPSQVLTTLPKLNKYWMDPRLNFFVN
jgi:hypothetical protein